MCFLLCLFFVFCLILLLIHLPLFYFFESIFLFWILSCINSFFFLFLYILSKKIVKKNLEEKKVEKKKKKLWTVLNFFTIWKKIQKNNNVWLLVLFSSCSIDLPLVLFSSSSICFMFVLIHTYSSSDTLQNNTKTSIVNSMKVKHKCYATNILDSSLHATWYHFKWKTSSGA